jgi:hypothetical protein
MEHKEQMTVFVKGLEPWKRIPKDQRDPRRNFSVPEKNYLFNRDGGVCGLCEGDISPDDRWAADHVFEWSIGGPTSLDNAQPSHHDCNSAKKFNIETGEITGPKIIASIPQRKNAAKCGTISGYQKHKRNKEEACEDCKRAIREYTNARNANKTLEN